MTEPGFEVEVIPAREVPLNIYMSDLFAVMAITCPSCGERFAMPYPIEVDPAEVDRVAAEMLQSWAQEGCGNHEFPS